MVSFDELSPQYQSGIRNFLQMPSHIHQFLANTRQNDPNFFLNVRFQFKNSFHCSQFFQIHIPSFQSVAGIASVLFVAYSSIASTKKYSTINLLDVICISAQSVSIGTSLICILLAGLTIATGITLICKLASGVPAGYRRIMIIGQINNEIREDIIELCGGKKRIESILNLKKYRQTAAMIISFKNFSGIKEIVESMNDEVVEFGGKSCLVTNEMLLNALRTRENNGVARHLEYGDEFEKGVEAGEALVSSLVLEKLLKSKLESTKTMVEIRKWKVELFIIFNDLILLTSTIVFLYAYFTIESKSKGFTCIHLYGSFVGLVGVIVGFVGNAYKKKRNHPESIVMFVNRRAGIQVIEVFDVENYFLVLGHHYNADVVANAKMMMARELTPEVGELRVVDSLPNSTMKSNITETQRQYSEKFRIAFKLAFIEKIVMNNSWIKNEVVSDCLDSLVNDEEFKRGFQTGESAVVAESLEILLEKKLDAAKLNVHIGRLAIDMNVVYNATILISTAFTVLYSYLSSETGSFNVLSLYGCLIGLSGVILGLASNWINGRKCATNVLALFVKDGQEKEARSLLVGAGIVLFEWIQLSNEKLIVAHSNNYDIVKYAEKSLQHGMLED
ncbi:hypothetical protein CRE_07082 [Caenorhabditis remanei]|uniref:Uncharacterized protein n=1 Tax=Caenorhabditis remanei TaxID=31234 RepID=E3NK55_CAERE|nr:hypothetical protein CRE_07082 [Caenorhabditis remanei]